MFSRTNSSARARSCRSAKLNLLSPIIARLVIETNSCRTIAIMLASMIIITSILVPLERSQVDAKLIHIYHKYKSIGDRDMSAELINNSTVLVEAASSEDSQPSLALEYSSPMRRIMELIGHHPPVIVITPTQQTSSSSSSSESNSAKQSREREQVGQPAEPSNLQASNSLAQQQAWTLLNANQLIATSQPAAVQLAAQPQQLIQTSIPYEQYFGLASPTGGQFIDTSNQIALVPAGTFAFPAPQSAEPQTVPPGGPQMAGAMFQPQSQLPQQQHQHQHQQQNQAGLEDRAQPIFLTSYVPEIPIQANQLVGSAPVLEQRPNSIQQIQRSQVADQQLSQHHEHHQPVQLTTSRPKRLSPEPSAEDPSGGAENEQGEHGDIASVRLANSSQEPDDSSSDNSDGGEQSEAKRNQAESEQGPSSGSMSYEDKYDSDKDGEPPRSSSGQEQELPPASSNSSTRRTGPAEESPRPLLADGLVGVGLNDDCLQCICRASSGCDHLLRCITRGSDEKYCGPFQLTEEYWNAAGSPGDAANNFQSFEDCANEADCAVETVTNYMKKHYRDCDGDDNITCMDYARLHRLKPSECDNTAKLVDHFDAYWAKFQRCAEGYNRSRNGDDEDI